MRKLGPLALLAILAGSCGPGPTAEHPASAQKPDDPNDELAKLAKTLDPGPITPTWSTLPEALRRDVEARAPKPTSNGDRLSFAESRLALDGFEIDLDADLEAHEAIRAHFEALYLLEPVVFGDPSPEQYAAIRALSRFWAVASRFEKIGVAAAMNAYVRNDPVLDADLLAGLAKSSARQSRALAVRVIREGEGKAFIHLKDVALGFEEREDFGLAHAIWTALLTRDPWMTPGDWLTVARVGVAVDDQPLVTRALNRARKAAAVDRADVSEAVLLDVRQVAGAVRKFEKHAARAASLRTRAGGTDLDARVAQAELLEETDRKLAALAIWQTLPKTDPRVRLRLSQALLARGNAHETFPKLVAEAQKTLEEGATPNAFAELPEYRSWSFGLVATLAMIELTKSTGSRDTLAKVLPGVVLRVKAENALLAKVEPGRAAAADFLLDQALISVASPTPLVDLEKRLPVWLPALEASIGKYPETRDLYRLLYAALPMVTDAKRALAILAKVPSGDDGTPDPSVQRATVATMLAAYHLTPEFLVFAQQAADAIPDGETFAVERFRETLRADIEGLFATTTKEVKRWRRATELYEAAGASVSLDTTQRVTSNLGFTMVEQGLSADAHEQFVAAGQKWCDRRWVIAIDNATAMTSKREDIFEVLKDLEVDREQRKLPTPLVLDGWRASVDPDPAAKTRYAKKFVEKLATSTEYVKIPRKNFSVDVEGAFQLSMRIAPWGRSRVHVLQANYEGLVWFVKPPPLSEKDLRDLARK